MCKAVCLKAGMIDEIRWDEKAGLRTGCGVRPQVIDVLEAQIKRRPAMKKVSTAATMQSRNISRQKLTIGLDLGDRNCWYCVVDEAGRYKGNSESGRMRKRCAKSSAPCRAVGSHWKSDAFALDQSLAQRVGA